LDLFLLFLSTASSKTVPLPDEEEKIRHGGESVAKERLGSSDASTPDWYDKVPPNKTRVSTWTKPWSLSGELMETCLPVLVGRKNERGDTTHFGYVIRVSDALDGWEEEDSDYIYFDVYNDVNDTMMIVRCTIERFMDNWDFEFDEQIGHYEDTAKKVLNKAVDDAGPRLYGDFIQQTTNYIDTYYRVCV
jgi:hypothetical protein